MAKTEDQIANLDAELDALSSPTTDQTYVVSKDYDADIVAASAARRTGPLLKESVHVTAAEILAIGDGTPKVLIAAPESGTVLFPQIVVFSYRAGSVAYDWDPGLIVTWSGFQGINVSAGSVVLNTLDDKGYFARVDPFGIDTDSGNPATTPQGQALVLTATNAGPFSEPFGDGTLDVTIYYTETTFV